MRLMSSRGRATLPRFGSQEGLSQDPPSPPQGPEMQGQSITSPLAPKQGTKTPRPTNPSPSRSSDSQTRINLLSQLNQKLLKRNAGCSDFFCQDVSPQG